MQNQLSFLKDKLHSIRQLNKNGYHYLFLPCCCHPTHDMKLESTYDILQV